MDDEKNASDKTMQPLYGSTKETKDVDLETSASVSHKPSESGVFTLRNAAHPVVCLFSFLFKILAVFCYFVLGLIFDDPIILFVVVLIFSAMDFYTIKNISGRKLVGLRWWSEINENNKESWHFESYEHEYKPNSVDSSCFWVPQVSASVFWGLVFVLDVLGLKFYWVLILIKYFRLWLQDCVVFYILQIFGLL